MSCLICILILLVPRMEQSEVNRRLQCLLMVLIILSKIQCLKIFSLQKIKPSSMRIIIFNMKAASFFIISSENRGYNLESPNFSPPSFFRPQAFWMFFLLLIFYGQPAFSAASFLLFLPVYRTTLRLQKPESVSSENFLSHHIPLPYWILPLDFRYPDLRILFGRC